MTVRGVFLTFELKLMNFLHLSLLPVTACQHTDVTICSPCLTCIFFSLSGCGAQSLVGSCLHWSGKVHSTDTVDWTGSLSTSGVSCWCCFVAVIWVGSDCWRCDTITTLVSPRPRSVSSGPFTTISASDGPPKLVWSCRQQLRPFLELKNISRKIRRNFLPTRQ